jgi:hypothetical protein
MSPIVTLLEHLREFPKPTFNLDFLARLRKTALKQLHISTPNLSALEKNNPIAWIFSRAYRSANLKVEGRGKNN